MKVFNDLKGELFITSDEHYGHYNILEFCDRPYENTTDMDNGLITNHNSIVSENDTTIHLGDFIWKGYKFEEIINQLNGFHIFIKGNHDHSYPKPTKGHKYQVLENQILEFEYMKKRFVACHYPLYEWNGSFRGSKHFYGHSHKERQIKNAYHVGVDTNEYLPINLKTFLT